MNTPVLAPTPVVKPDDYCFFCDAYTSHVIKPGPTQTTSQCQECRHTEVVQTGGKAK